MKKFIIERDIPEIGKFEDQQYCAAAEKSNEALAELGPDIQWVETYVAGNQTFCVYLAKDENILQAHSELSGFPANRITEIKRMMDPTTAG